MIPTSIPKVLFVKSSSHPTAPLVLDSPHSGTLYPEDFNYCVPLEKLRQAEDTYVDELYEDAAALGAMHMGALFPRSYVDVNRGLHELDPNLIDGTWPAPLSHSEKSDLGIGLIWRKCRPNQDIYPNKLSVNDTQKRLDTYWHPYHRCLKQLLDNTHQQFGQVWHINCHSMPSDSDALSKEGPGHRRPEFCLGDRGGTTCAPEFTQLVKATLEQLGYQVTINDPYAGVELVRAYANPGQGRHSLQVEIRRDLYMDEETFEKTPNFTRLQTHLSQLTQTLIKTTQAWASAQ